MKTTLLCSAIFLFTVGCASEQREFQDYPTAKAQIEEQESPLASPNIDSVDDYPLTEEMREGYYP